MNSLPSTCPEPDIPWTEEVDEFNRFRMDNTVFVWSPSEEFVRDMIFLVAYDIRCPKRLRKVAKSCEDYGVRVEYSVFECDLSEECFNIFWDELNGIIDSDEDAVVAYRICRSCIKETQAVGSVVRPVKPLLYMV